MDILWTFQDLLRMDIFSTSFKIDVNRSELMLIDQKRSQQLKINPNRSKFMLHYPN